MGRERREGGARFLGKQFIYMTPRDLDAFSQALRREFPGIRFVDRDNDGLNTDWEATRNDPDREAKLRLFAGLSRPVVAKPRDQWRLYEYDSLADFREPYSRQCFHILFADPGWQPIWDLGLTGHASITNLPEHSIDFSRPMFHRHGDQKRHNGMPPEPRGTGIIELLSGSMSGVYYPWEDAWLKTLRRVQRIFSKLVTNKYCAVDLYTLDVRVRVGKGGMDWIGLHALDWARGHPCNFVRSNVKPIDWTPPLPEERDRLGITLPLVPPPESVFAHQRRREARMRENARRRKEALQAQQEASES